MSLRTCNDQSPTQSIQALYTLYRQIIHRQTAKPSFREAAERMLLLLPRLEELCRGRDVWGLFSVGDLLLTNQKDFHGPALVYVSTWEEPSGGYVVSYLLPRDIAPRPHARVSGHTKDIDQTLMMIEKALHASGGWQ
jgi:hypothetical protein